MKIPHTSLSKEALQGVIREFILREGTDYGDREWTLDEKVQQVLAQLKSGKASITYDDSSDTHSIS
jgi:hypothetical protein